MLELKKITKQYFSKDKAGRNVIVTAVRPLSLQFDEGYTYALVGESGSGKSTLARLILGLEKPTDGAVFWDSQDVSSLHGKQFRQKRADVQMVLQNARSSFDPRLKIYDSIAEPMRRILGLQNVDIRHRIMELVAQVRLPPSLLERLPHTLSGGQLKRAGIARALATKPKFIVFDEAVSGLDVTVKKRILDLIINLKSESGFLFITHDIDAALYVADHVLVMKEGELVEQVRNTGSYSAFNHEYSRLLINAMPH